MSTAPRAGRKLAGAGAAGTDADPTLQNALRPLRDLLNAMEADLAALYELRGVSGGRPRFSIALIRLQRLGPMTVTELAEQAEVTHSAMSQTVTAMRRHGLVESVPGTDARTRRVDLTDDGRALVPFLEAEWRATESAWAGLEAELPYPLGQVVGDLAAALERTSFLARVTAELDAQRPRPGRRKR